MNQYPKRLIEVDLPIKRISAHARDETKVKKGHLRTLHIWWARRPLAACRAVICASLWFDPADEKCPQNFRVAARDIMRSWGANHRSLMSSDSYERFEKANRESGQYEDNLTLRALLLDFIADFADWTHSNNKYYLEISSKLTAAAHEANGGISGTLPLVVDPFAGSGSIPFEALRSGAGSFAGDLNPIPILLCKVSQQYLPRFGSELLEAFDVWSDHFLVRAKKELTKFYSASKDKIPVAYIWARTIQCEGPSCGAEVPLIGLLWLSKKKGNSWALRYKGNEVDKTVDIEVFRPASTTQVQPPIVKKMAATCPCCSYTTPYKSVRQQLTDNSGGTAKARLVAVVELDGANQRHFRVASPEDREYYEAAARELAHREAQHQGRVTLVPDEPLPPDGTLGYRINKYGIERWGEVYLRRQALSLSSMATIVNSLRNEMHASLANPELADAVSTCLGLAIGNSAHYQSAVSIYTLEHMISAFVQGSGLAMRPDFAEANPLIPSLVGGVEYALDLIRAVLRREQNTIRSTGEVQRASAAKIPLPDDVADAVITDPPYYDAIPYAALSDFCYVWLKRAIGDIHPELFQTSVTSKTEECIMDPGGDRSNGRKRDREFFEESMQAALADSRRVLRPDGIGVVIFAHKGTAAWETLLAALLNAGWIVTASWPIDTENSTRLRAKNSAALSSSVHLVCRARENIDGSLGTEIGDWRDILRELPPRIHQWMAQLAREGVVGADAIFSCIGPALEIFSRYSRVVDASDRTYNLKDYLQYVWAAVAKEALDRIFEGADATGFEEDARLTAMWLWTLFAGAAVEGADSEIEAEDSTEEEDAAKAAKSAGYILEYDAARKIAQGLGAHLEDLTSIIEVKGDKARLLPVSERARDLFGYVDSSATEKKRKPKAQKKLFEEMEEFDFESTSGIGGAPEAGATTLDRIHQTMLLFGAGRSEAVRRFLVDDGVGNDERFWRLANALSALYPSGTDEKRWVDGVLARKKGLGF